MTLAGIQHTGYPDSVDIVKVVDVEKNLFNHTRI